MSFLQTHTRITQPAPFGMLGYERRDDCTRPRYFLMDFNPEQGVIEFHISGETFCRYAKASAFMFDDDELEKFSPRHAFVIGQLTMMKGAS